MRTKPSDWRDSTAGQEKYLARRAEAQARANATGFDHGLEKNDFFKDFEIKKTRASNYGIA